ncbi:MAG: N-acetyl-alpha-D-glucosaminyl L-malate synthase BshA [Gemmatimonadota bacterium]|nr:N-acetyl-alpha-D-glucosaminyl L-malate synthase BshA [Gemmatimonadota bacterium]
MNIGIMCHSSFGGSARIGTNLAIELARRDHRVHLFTRTVPFGSWDPDTGVLLHRTVAEQDNTFHPMTLYTDWPDHELDRFTTNVFQVIDTDGLDVLHFHYAVPFAALSEAVKSRLGDRAPLLIGTLHGTDVTVCGRDPVKGAGLARALQALDGLTTVSACHAALTAEVFKLEEPPVVIPNFVDLQRFRPLDDFFRGSRNVPPISRIKIAHVSNFRPVKYLEGLADIFRRIRQNVDAELWLIGDGQEMDRIKTILQRSGVDKNIYYWGIQRNVSPILSQADLFVISSHYESFCLAALEAMACGVPVIGPRVGGVPEVVEHGKTGFLYAPGDYAAAAGYAVSVLSDFKRLNTMSEAAVRHAVTYDSRIITGRYEEYYRSLLSKKRNQMQRNAAVCGGIFGEMRPAKASS